MSENNESQINRDVWQTQVRNRNDPDRWEPIKRACQAMHEFRRNKVAYAFNQSGLEELVNRDCAFLTYSVCGYQRFGRQPTEDVIRELFQSNPIYVAKFNAIRNLMLEYIDAAMDSRGAK